jgi:hypothetical protein
MSHLVTLVVGPALWAACRPRSGIFCSWPGMSELSGACQAGNVAVSVQHSRGETTDIYAVPSSV